ncbi:hypothetical protein ATI61_107482 [Archangium gephyra]|uniref:SH3 domain-containing protein n=1 Tax=Archangium gephyra TaxID=48 RepID=A0AAC8QJ31_9BACT|nr:hypothetical protein [Archangium gephyra]AKJ08045.1 Hypothetical protein AA314_09671 [Archangium gephyra]REG29786.1 hypothetical protein ATI61_107482 [Archangium gephyra]
MLLLPLLVTAVLQASPGDALFVHASSLNLRAKPKASASIRLQVPIGSPCSVVAVAKDGWAELECLEVKGFGKLELLGASPPDHAQLLAQGREPGRPLADALNLLQRAVTLKPEDEPTQQAFRELYWKAELERLVKARAAKDTLKEPRESPFSEACGDPEACVKAALQSESVWQDVRVRGTDAVLVQLYADGLFHLRSGAIDTDKRTVTVQLESLTVPSAAVLRALGARDVQDACQPQGEQMCGFAYDQSCAPDNCWEPYQSCQEGAATACQECKSTCNSPCNSCRMKCGGTNRKECVARCIEAARECEAECQAPADSGYKSCEAEYKTCSAEAAREWQRTCERPCNRTKACVDNCQKKNPGMNQWACIDRCDDRLPESCSHECLFGYQ